MLKTSIAMATFNGGRYIKEQLQSFADQTLKPDELVITDDGSTFKGITTVREVHADQVGVWHQRYRFSRSRPQL